MALGTVMADLPSTLLPFPDWVPNAWAQWINALFWSVLVPICVAGATTWIAGAPGRRQFNSTALSAKQKAAARIIDACSDFGRAVDARLRSSDADTLVILADLALPDMRDDAALLGPKVAMQFQNLKDVFAEENDAIREVHAVWNEALQSTNDRTAPNMISASICHVLSSIYALVRLAAKASGLPHKPRWRLREEALERRLKTAISMLPFQSPPRNAGQGQ